MNTSLSISSAASRRDFWRRFFRLMLTIALQNIIVYSVNLLDNVMIGRYSELALSGVFIVNQIQFLLHMLVTGIADGTVVIASRFWGEGNIDSIKRTAATALRFALGFSLLLTLVALIFPNYVLGIFTDKPYVIEEAAKYLQIVCLSYLFFSATQVLLGMLRSVECAYIGFANSCAALVINGVLNYILIFGHFGAPELGIRGAAIATLISRIVEFLIIVVYIAFFDKKLRAKFMDFLKTEAEITRKFIKVSLPVVLSGTLWGVAMGLQTSILGRLTDSVISANSIASTLFQILTVFIFASSTAAAIMIGKTLGESTASVSADALKAELSHRAKVLQLIFLGLGLATGILLFVFKDVIIGFYNIEEETRQLALQFMTVLSVTVVGTAYEAPVLCGIVRGGGDTKFVLYNDTIFMWGIVLPASFLAAFVFHLSPVVIFICLKSDQILKCIVAYYKVNHGNWMKKI